MRQPRRLRLDDQLCFSLYAATNAITRAYRTQLESLGLTYPQYLVMLVLWQDGPSTIGHIAKRLCLAQNAITPLLDRLERSGCLRRVRDLEDRRVVHVQLTDQGIGMEAAVSLAQQEVECSTLLDAESLHDLRSELFALVSRMEDAERESTVSQKSKVKPAK